MSISLTGPTAAVTTSSGTLSAATFTFVSDQANDLRSKVYAVSAIGGTATGANIHSVQAPKQVIVKRPATFAMMSGYNQTSGLYARVPKNVTRVVGKGSCKVGTNQWEVIPMSADFGIPAGSSYDVGNLEASIAMFIAALWDQKEEIIKAVQDGLY
jgi:hypothetical protein